MMAYICDRCGKIISRPAGDIPIRKIIYFGEASYDDPADGGELTSLDLCDCCWDSFHHWKRMYLAEDKNE